MDGLRRSLVSLRQRGGLGVAAAFRPACRPVWAKRASDGTMDAESARWFRHARAHLVRHVADFARMARLAGSAQPAHWRSAFYHLRPPDCQRLRALLFRERKCPRAREQDAFMDRAAFSAARYPACLARETHAPLRQ